MAAIAMPQPANAAPLTSMYLTLGTPSTGAINTDLTISFSSGAYAQCVRAHFGSAPAMSGTLPAGMSFATPVMRINGVAWTTTTNADYVQATFGPGDTPNGATAIHITNVTNPSTPGTYYASIETFLDTGCTSPVSTGTLAFDVHDYGTVSVDVPPSFTFTVANRATTCNGESDFLTGAGSATAVALGNMPVSSNRSGAQELSVAGNAGNGFTVYLRGSQAVENLRSAGHNWVDVAATYPASTTLAAGEQFGYTFNDTSAATTVTNPTAANFIGLDGTNRAVMGSNTASSGTGCVAFDAQTGPTTPAGNYTATVVYTAVPRF
jgi:hypothetical protein